MDGCVRPSVLSSGSSLQVTSPSLALLAHLLSRMAVRALRWPSSWVGESSTPLATPSPRKEVRTEECSKILKNPQSQANDSKEMNRFFLEGFFLPHGLQTSSSGTAVLFATFLVVEEPPPHLSKSPHSVLQLETSLLLAVYHPTAAVYLEPSLAQWRRQRHRLTRPCGVRHSRHPGWVPGWVGRRLRLVSPSSPSLLPRRSDRGGTGTPVRSSLRGRDRQTDRRPGGRRGPACHDGWRARGVADTQEGEAGGGG